MFSGIQTYVPTCARTQGNTASSAEEKCTANLTDFNVANEAAVSVAAAATAAGDVQLSLMDSD